MSGFQEVRVDNLMSFGFRDKEVQNVTRMYVHRRRQQQLQRMAEGAIASCGYDHGGPAAPKSGEHITTMLLYTIRNAN